MMYSVQLSRAAAKSYGAAPLPLAKKLARCFEQLERDPRESNMVKALRAEWAGLFRYRVGDYRVVFRIDDANRIVHVVTIAHRREVYE